MFSRRNTTVVREACSLQPNMDDTMEDFRKETMKALWQAFDTLDQDKTGLVHVSQLKVITSNIGMKMGMDKAEELLKDNGAKSEMDFKAYFDTVKTELIDKMEGVELSANVKKPIGERLNSVLKTCWTFCNFERNHKSKWLSFDHCLVLWRLFNFLSEVDDMEEPLLPVKLHSDEADMLLKNFVEITGQKNKESAISDSLRVVAVDTLTFTDFINIFEKDCVTNLSKSDISHGLNYLQDKFLMNILGKGMVYKRGFKVKNWKERWLVMTPKHIKYYVSSNEKVLKGVIELDSECKVEILPDRPTLKPNRFVLHTDKKPYEMSAPDMKTKNEWVSGIQLALDHLGQDTNLQHEAARERRKARQERRLLAEEDERRRREEEEYLKQKEGELDEEKRKRREDEELLQRRLQELEEEKRRREEAEARFLEEKAQKEAEQERLRELEEIKRELERLLEEERQAKKDEEIVRNLQARLLEEEFQRREELEQLKQQQDEMLRCEREQKAILEEDKLEQERILRQAKERLDALETEQARAAQKMQEASDKLQRAEKDRRIMEEKVKLWKTPVGLARPIKPTPNPFITHRGQGAFCDRDFQSHDKNESESLKTNSEDPETQNNDSSGQNEKATSDTQTCVNENVEKCLETESDTNEIKLNNTNDQDKADIPCENETSQESKPGEGDEMCDPPENSSSSVCEKSQYNIVSDSDNHDDDGKVNESSIENKIIVESQDSTHSERNN